MRPSIRAAGGADIRAVLALWRLAESVPSPTDSEPALRLLLDRDPEALLLAAADDEVVGSLIAAWDGWRGSFYRLAVHPEHRRRGLATALIRAGEARLQALGAVRLTAIVAAEEPGAAELWAAAGYERQPDRHRFIRMVRAR